MTGGDGGGGSGGGGLGNGAAGLGVAGGGGVAGGVGGDEGVKWLLTALVTPSLAFLIMGCSPSEGVLSNSLNGHPENVVVITTTTAHATATSRRSTSSSCAQFIAATRNGASSQSHAHTHCTYKSSVLSFARARPCYITLASHRSRARDLNVSSLRRRVAGLSPSRNR